MSDQEASVGSAPGATVESEADATVGGGTRTRAVGTKTCVTCGAVIDEKEWFPVRGREDEDGEFRIYSFCSEECVGSWER